MNLDDRKMCAEFAGWTKVGFVELGKMYGHGPHHETQVPDYDIDPAAAHSLLPKLMQEIVRRGGYSRGHYDARQLWLDLIEKSNSLTRPEEVCRLIVEAVRGVAGKPAGGGK